MATDWIKMRADLLEKPTFARFVAAVPCSHESGLALLYRVAGWFEGISKYGKIEAQPSIIDVYLGIDGVANALASVDWLRYQRGFLTLHGFCAPSATRKSLGRAIRQQVLSGSACAACDSRDRLVIDHIIPIARGGTCGAENLQALCDPCNRAKGRRTMSEF